MKYTTRVTALLLAAGTLLNSGAALAARGDVYKRDGDKIVNPDKPEKTYSQLVGSDKVALEVGLDAELFGIEGNDGKIYKMEDILNVTGKIGDAYFDAFEDYSAIFPVDGQKQKCETLTYNYVLAA